MAVNIEADCEVIEEIQDEGEIYIDYITCKIDFYHMFYAR